jgi:hypothetical protein
MQPITDPRRGWSQNGGEAGMSEAKRLSVVVAESFFATLRMTAALRTLRAAARARR